MITINRIGLLIIVLHTIVNFCDNKIVYLISPPRSLSVAFLRMMHTRGDFAIMNEPSQMAFINVKGFKTVSTWFKPEALPTFNHVKDAIIRTSQTQHVFAKEMAFAIEEFHCNDQELMKLPNAYFVFLVRNPHHTILSMYKKHVLFHPSADHLDAILGYHNLWNIIQTVDAHAANKPYIIYTEDLYTDPYNSIKQFCEHIGIEFKPAALSWPSLEHSNFDVAKEWSEVKYPEFVSHWHGDAMNSTGFAKPQSYEVDQDGNPTFSEVQNAEHREMCRTIYYDQLQYYQLICKYHNTLKATLN